MLSNRYYSYFLSFYDSTVWYVFLLEILHFVWMYVYVWDNVFVSVQNICVRWFVRFYVILSSEFLFCFVWLLIYVLDATWDSLPDIYDIWDSICTRCYVKFYVWDSFCEILFVWESLFLTLNICLRCSLNFYEFLCFVC